MIANKNKILFRYFTKCDKTTKLLLWMIWSESSFPNGFNLSLKQYGKLAWIPLTSVARSLKRLCDMNILTKYRKFYTMKGKNAIYKKYYKFNKELFNEEENLKKIASSF